MYLVKKLLGETRVVKVLHEKCDKKVGADPKLPYSAYLVEYLDKDGNTCFDVTIGDKAVDIFDHYYDKSGKFVNMTQSGGRVNPKQWVDPNAPAPKKRGKR